MLHYRKIGGLHWFSLGRFRIAFCICQRRPRYRHGIRIIDHPFFRKYFYGL